MKNYFVIFGPERSGTNYLSELLLMNTPGEYPRIANLDRAPNHNINSKKRVDLVHNKLGSKHKLEDKPLETKFSKNNINIFLARSDFTLWVNSLARYRGTYDKNFEVNESFVKSCHKRYIDYFNFLSVNHKSINCGIVFLENLNKNILKVIAQKMQFLLNKDLVDIGYRMNPGGSKGRKYIEREYSNETELSKIVFKLYKRKIGDNQNPIDYLAINGINTNNLLFL